MAESEIPDRLLPAIRLAVFWIGLPFIFLLVGVERIFDASGNKYQVAACISAALISLAIAVYWDRIIVRLWPRYNRVPSLSYLTYRDSDLSSAIISAARHSAYGRWYAAQILVNSGQPIQQRYLLHVMANQVMDKIIDGEIQVRGRRPGQMEYEAIPRTYWRSTAFYVAQDQLSIWKIVLAPRGGVELDSNGNIVRASDPAAVARTTQLADYDSLLVDAYEFEKVWPVSNFIADKKRRRFLRQARKRNLNPDEIQRLS
jgi:hypothetical protein